MRVFHISVNLWLFYKSLTDRKSPHVSKTFLRILANLNNVVVWTISTSPVIFNSSSPCTNHLVTVPRASITISIIVTLCSNYLVTEQRVPVTLCIIVTFMFHSFFSSLTRSKCLSLFSHSFTFTLRSVGTTKSLILQVLSFLLIIIRSGGVCVCHSPGQILGCA